jgi:hypothetical protein
MTIRKRNYVGASVLACTLVAILASYRSNAEPQWVSPSEYTFGECAGIGGDSIPGILNQKFYSRYTCRKTIDARMCATQAREYERRFADRRINSCGSWLQRELRNCEQHVEQAANLCDSLPN